MFRNCPDSFCYKCDEPGHISTECSTGSSGFKTCNRCRMKGHRRTVSGLLSVVIGPDKVPKMKVKCCFFSYPPVKTFVWRSQKNCHFNLEIVLLSTHSMFWLRNNKNKNIF